MVQLSDHGDQVQVMENSENKCQITIWHKLPRVQISSRLTIARDRSNTGLSRDAALDIYSGAAMMWHTSAMTPMRMPSNATKQTITDHSNQQRRFLCIIQKKSLSSFIHFWWLSNKAMWKLHLSRMKMFWVVSGSHHQCTNEERKMHGKKSNTSNEKNTFYGNQIKPFKTKRDAFSLSDNFFSCVESYLKKKCRVFFFL